jgi:hypothetical protein
MRSSAHKEIAMIRFKLGGSGPDGGGLGWVSGIIKRRFDKSGEIYETDDPCEIQALRRCPYVEEMADDADEIPVPPVQSKHVCSREVLRHKKMRELIKIGRGLYRVGMTKTELINRIISRDRRVNCTG